MSDPIPTPEPKPKRKYSSKRRANREGIREDDPKFAENSRTWQALFLKKLIEFKTFDPQFTTTYANDWLAAIEEFEGQPSDETMNDELQQTSADLDEATALFFKALNDIEYYFEKAFPDNERLRMEFGFEQLRNPGKRGNVRLIIHAFTLERVLQDYFAELTAAGLTNAMLTTYQDAINDMADKELAQEYTKRLRIRATTKRVKLYNNLYKFWLQVHKAAAVIYAENEVVRAQWSR